METRYNHRIVASTLVGLSIFASMLLHADSPDSQTALQQEADQAENSVCGWYEKNEWKLFLCGPKTSLEGMIQESNVDALAKRKPRATTKAVKASKSIAMFSPPAAIDNAAIDNTAIENVLISKAPIDHAPISPTPGNKTSTKTSFLVAIVGKGIVESKAAIEKLQGLAETDYILMRSPPYKNRVSVGVYSSYQNALYRQSKIQSHGISTEIIDRTQNTIVKTIVKTSVKKTTVATQVLKKPEAKRKRKKSVPKGYLLASIDDTATTVSKLELTKDKDFLVMRAAPYFNRISLGVYSNRNNAIKRQNQLQAQGIATKLINRSENTIERIAAVKLLDPATKSSQSKSIAAL